MQPRTRRQATLTWRHPYHGRRRATSSATRHRRRGRAALAGQEIPDGHIFYQPWPAGPADQRRDQVIYYQYRADRARRTLRGIDEQVAKAERAVAGKTAVKRNRFIQLTGATKTVNRGLKAKARNLAGIIGIRHQPGRLPDGTPATAQFVIDAYHQLFQIEKSFRMSKHDLQARPIYHHQRDSIEALWGASSRFCGSRTSSRPAAMGSAQVCVGHGSKRREVWCELTGNVESSSGAAVFVDQPTQHVDPLDRRLTAARLDQR